MSSPVFVQDAQGTPLMPMSSAYARRLLQRGSIYRHPHYAFTVLRLTQVVEQPTLRPLVLGVVLHLHTSELLLLADGEHKVFPLMHIIVDLRRDLSWRIRRRAAHRRRRRSRMRYHAYRRQGQPFKLRRHSLARSRWGTYLRRQPR